MTYRSISGGGYLLSGQFCCVGFKALRGDGTSAVVSGVVRDDRGQDVVTFSSLHAGVGKFVFTPQAGCTYTAVCTDNAHERDLRTTLYWNPALHITDGKAVVEFYTGDEEADYALNLDGITNSIKNSILTTTFNF